MLKKSLLLPLLLLVGYTYAQPSYQFSSLNVNDGLSNNQVNCIYKDAKGFMWFGTMSGLNRYDGYSFKIFRNDITDPHALRDDYISGIYPAPGNQLFIRTRNGDNIYDPVRERFSDATLWLRKRGLPEYGISSITQTGNIWWIAYTDAGLYKMDSTGKATKIKIPGRAGANIADLKKDRHGRLVILYLNGDVEKLDIARNRVVYRNTSIRQFITKRPLSLRIFIDSQEDMWVYMPETDFGAVYLSQSGDTLKKLSNKTGYLNNDIVNSVVEDDKHLIWIGTDHGGINLIDKKDNFRSRFLLNKEGDPKSVAEDAIYALFKDDFGIVWCGTYKRGISYFTENLLKFPLYKHNPSDGHSLSYDDVNCFAEDKKGNIWIGTNGGGLIYYDRSDQTFKRFQHNPSDDNSISKDVILSLYVNDRNDLWIGYYFGGMDYYSNGRFTHYRHEDNDPNSLANKSVWKIYKDKRNNFWVGTLGGGLDRFDPGNGIFYHNNVNLPASVHSNFITAFAEDSRGNLWISTAYGIDVLDNSKGIFVHYLNSTHQLSNDNVSSLLYDKRGHMWAGTRAGLNVFDEKTQLFRSFTVKDGLPDNNIISILEDNEGFIWVSTSNGLSKITVNEGTEAITISCRNYDDKDGLQGKAFNVNAACKLSTGELIFGGADGFNIFTPSSLPRNKTRPAVVFTGLRLFDRDIEVNAKVHNRVLLPEALSEIKEIALRHNENDFSIDFAALNFINARKNKYAYKLEGFNTDWQIADGATKRITYTNIGPGTYTLQLKAANDDGLWNEEGISLKIRVKPPFWKTPLAYITYVVLIVVVLLLLRENVIRRARKRFVLEQERQEARRMHELDMMKIKLFTNLSHEFRTPVSLILSPLEEIMQHGGDQKEKNKFQLIYRNAKRLLILVNQLMDFRKMEMQELRLAPSRGDIAVFIEEVAGSFADLAERKQVTFSYESNSEHIYTWFDHDKTERILFNLLSNAFKFTPQGGTVSVEVTTSEEGERTWLEIKVRDTGIGIPPERHEKIFEQFFHSDMPGGFMSRGSGIGLAITKEFVKLSNGTITVDSQVNQGSCFTVRLPLEICERPEAGMEVEQAAGEETDLREPEMEAIAAVTEMQAGRSTILLIEDNSDFRFYLKENLKDCYNILEAADGATGWQKTLSGHPDLVMSDINMPGMNGIELCRKIKNDSRTRHIPVLLVTASAGEHEQLRGLEAGAADYLVKPFNFEIMLSRVRNLLTRPAPARHQVTLPAVPESAQEPSPNEKFLQRALAIVERNLSNADFSVEELSRELFMNRVSVYRRIFNLTGQTPVEFIRMVRIKKAAQLLSKTEMNVTEVAYEVGFNNPKYFTKYFKIAYNMLPSAYVATMRGK
ncbi:hybrid sensor histidine kinase/response regulator transcription factor [Chitinophaga tropicalis]|uniref:histidine kinase n=1 Tax=Chitinophaga tropicalis TaxID=2683588 RepID=A0A7K1U1M9_9BACT|nr:hybrid sensor histidine kinase/response regulator transcription factor [Chitinophaga tropicalis]MVT08186.1 response regulator [Chitinophaga tropicalis]